MRAMVRLAMVSITIAVVVALAITNVPAPVHARRPQVAIIGGGAHTWPSTMHHTCSSSSSLSARCKACPGEPCQLTLNYKLRLQRSGCGWTHSPICLEKPPLLRIHCLCSELDLVCASCSIARCGLVHFLLRTPQLGNYMKSMQSRNTSHQFSNVS